MYGKVGVQKMAQTKSKYTVDDIPVKDIQNGMIYLLNGLKVTGVKITPKNIFILDQGVQDAIIDNLRNVYNMIDYEFWVIAADRPVDIDLYLSQLQVLYNSTQMPNKRKMIMEDINKANMFTNNNVVDTEYFILFRERNPELIQKRIRLLINGLAMCNLNSSQTTNDDLRTLLENFLNGGVRTKQGTVISV